MTNHNPLTINIHSQLAGRFKCAVGHIDESGNEVITQETGWFDNLITNNGLDLVATVDNGNQLAYAQVGTGSTTPAFGDTTLSNFRAATNTNQGDTNGQVTGPPRYGWRRVVRRFAQGAASGNISEIGMSPSAAGNLYSRALILDGSGNPTTISVLATDFLDVTYESRNYVNTSDIAGSITISGVTYATIVRPFSYSDNSPWSTYLPSLTGGQNSNNEVSIGETFPATGGTAISGTRQFPTKAAYTAGNRYRDFSGTWGIGVANFATGVGYIAMGTGLGYRGIGFTPKILKTNEYELKYALRWSWGRYVP